MTARRTETSSFLGKTAEEWAAIVGDKAESEDALFERVQELRAASIKLVAALDHWSAEGGGPEPRGIKINSATGRHATRVALEELREILSATTAI